MRTFILRSLGGDVSDSAREEVAVTPKIDDDDGLDEEDEEEDAAIAFFIFICSLICANVRVPVLPELPIFELVAPVFVLVAAVLGLLTPVLAVEEPILDWPSSALGWLISALELLGPAWEPGSVALEVPTGEILLPELPAIPPPEFHADNLGTCRKHKKLKGECATKRWVYE